MIPLGAQYHSKLRCAPSRMLRSLALCFMGIFETVLTYKLITRKAGAISACVTSQSAYGAEVAFDSPLATRYLIAKSNAARAWMAKVLT